MKEQTSSADRSQYPEAGCVDAARAADLDCASKQHRKAEPVKELGGRGGLSPTHGWKRLAPETMNGITCLGGSYAAHLRGSWGLRSLTKIRRLKRAREIRVIVGFTQSADPSSISLYVDVMDTYVASLSWEAARVFSLSSN